MCAQQNCPVQVPHLRGRRRRCSCSNASTTLSTPSSPTPATPGAQTTTSVMETLGPLIAKAIEFTHRYRLLEYLPTSFGLETTANRNFQRISDSCLNTKCTHPAHKNISETGLVHEMPAKHFEEMVGQDQEEFEENAGTVSKATLSMNSIFVKRLLEIEAKAPFDLALKLLTYQEWIDTLLKLNRALIKNMIELELEIAERTRKLTDGNKIKSEELTKCWRDISKLITYIQKQHRYDDNWSSETLNLESLAAIQVFGRESLKMRRSQQNNAMRRQR